MKKSEMIDYIAHCDLFQNLNKSQIKKIANLAHLEEFSPGEDIFCQGENCDKIYIIVNGSVYLERTVDLGKRKGKALVSAMGKGRALGCWCSLLGKPHKLMSYANCRKPTTALVISGAELSKIMGKDCEMGFRISQAMCMLLIDRIQGIYGAMENL